MAQCVKCGRQIPEGELFCAECSLNPGAAEMQPRETVQIPGGRMQTPVKRAAPLRPVPQTAEKRTVMEPPKRSGRVLTVCACILAVLGIGLAAWQFAGLSRQRRALRLREDDLEERELRLETLQTQIDDLSAELAAAEERSAAQVQQIETLTQTVNHAESNANQSQYDLSEQQKELERTADENETLTGQIETLKTENERLKADYDTLWAEYDAQNTKLKFMDSYVVFVEDDGTGWYHRYDCSRFLKKNFWAYSRKLAEKQGYTPCSDCFGG